MPSRTAYGDSHVSNEVGAHLPGRVPSRVHLCVKGNGRTLLGNSLCAKHRQSSPLLGRGVVRGEGLRYRTRANKSKPLMLSA